MTLRMPHWTLIVPGVSLPLAAAALAWPPGAALAAVCAVALCLSVVASVHHAEVVAHRVGEPFGTLILAVSVTVIEVALIVSMMLAGGSDNRRCRATRSSRRS
jgi:Ca2+:H+ antiporter